MQQTKPTCVELACDVLVAGGGPAGVPCALAAARNGARVILCQDRPVLGGNASSEVRMHIVGADGWRGKEFEVEAREGGIIEEIRLDCCIQNPQRSSSMLDLILYDKCRNEPNLNLMLNTVVDGAEVQGSRIVAAMATRSSTEERFRITAEVFVDCTGDGRLALESGCPFRQGREGKAEFGEQNAVEEPDRQTLGSTILFQAQEHPQRMPFTAPSWARKFSEADLEHRLKLINHNVNEGLEYGFWWIEWGGLRDTVKDNEHIRDELLAILFGVWDFIKNSGRYPEAENYALTWFGFLPGKRESRRFVGRHTMTEADVLSARTFPDAIAFGGWPIDLHPPAGVDAKDEPPCNHIATPYLYGIPLRSCLSSVHNNLLFAGRNISATHVAFASTRVMATCAVVGQGVGTAAAYASLTQVEPIDLPSSENHMSAIQQILLAQDCFLPGVANADPRDLARTASISASSEMPGFEAANVLSGQTRSTHGHDGVHPDLAVAGTHRWMSEAVGNSPAYLQLDWPEPVSISEIRLVFDTGMHRKLTLSHVDNLQKRMIWGRPQPETVSDYEIQISTNGRDWESVLKIIGNYQRVRKHRFDAPFNTRNLRLQVSSTHGDLHARLFELRVYS